MEKLESIKWHQINIDEKLRELFALVTDEDFDGFVRVCKGHEKDKPLAECLVAKLYDLISPDKELEPYADQIDCHKIKKVELKEFCEKFYGYFIEKPMPEPGAKDYDIRDYNAHVVNPINDYIRKKLS